MAKEMVQVAIALHVGSLDPLPELLYNLQHVSKAPCTYRLFASLVSCRLDMQKVRELILSSFPDAYLLEVENRGMDLGGFFRLLPEIYSFSPDYILKLHTKTDPHWRQLLIAPLCGSPEKFQRCLEILARSPRIGMLGSGRCLFMEVPFRRPNGYHLKRVTSQLNLPYGQRNFGFIGGTMFLVRTRLLQRVLTPNVLQSLQPQLNTPTSFDPNWYLTNYRDLRLQTVEQAILHHRVLGSGKARNCLEARERGEVLTLADGMIEHALERLMGLLVVVQGLGVQGV